jgi:hypothetical protein
MNRLQRVWGGFCQPSAWLLFVEALAIKLVLIGVWIAPATPAWVERFEWRKGYDDVEYYCIAQQMQRHGTLTFPGRAEPQIYRTPLYPAFLAALGVLCRWQPLVMLSLQAVVFSVAPILLWLILRRAGYATGFAWLLVADPITNILGITFMTEGLFILFLLAGFLLLLQAGCFSQRLGALLAFSLAILVKPSVQFFYVFICLYLLIRFRPRLPTLAAILVSALPLLGWTARNYQVAGRFVLTTQSNNSVLLPGTIRALAAHVPETDILKWVNSEWARDHQGRAILADVYSNRAIPTTAVLRFLRQHPLQFAQYHVLGSLRVLLGTGRMHVKTCFPVAEGWGPHAWRIFNTVMVGYYIALFGLLLLTLRRRSLRQPAVLWAWAFILYNVSLIGALAYTTGGGLKRAPFVPLVVLVLAGQIYCLKIRKEADSENS